jgi:hypothetical protein
MLLTQAAHGKYTPVRACRHPRLTEQIDAREVARRPLWAAQVEHGCLSKHGGLADDPPDTNETGFCLVRNGLLLPKQTRTAKHGLLPADARIVVRAVCIQSGCQRFVDCIPDLLDWVQVIVHHSARTPGCILRSKAAPPYLRTYPSSFVSPAGGRPAASSRCSLMHVSPQGGCSLHTFMGRCRSSLAALLVKVAMS